MPGNKPNKSNENWLIKDEDLERLKVTHEEEINAQQDEIMAQIIAEGRNRNAANQNISTDQMLSHELTKYILIAANIASEITSRVAMENNENDIEEQIAQEAIQRLGSDEEFTEIQENQNITVNKNWLEEQQKYLQELKRFLEWEKAEFLNSEEYVKHLEGENRKLSQRIRELEGAPQDLTEKTALLNAISVTSRSAESKSCENDASNSEVGQNYRINHRNNSSFETQISTEFKKDDSLTPKSSVYVDKAGNASESYKKTGRG